MRWILFAMIALLSTASCAAEPQGAERQIRVAGSGFVEMQPDAAAISMGIESQHKDLQQARQRVNEQVAAFLKVVEGLGIEARYVRTAGLNVRPEYRWGEDRRKRYLDGYRVSRELHIDLRDLEKLGALMERAVSAGVNQVQSPQFRLADEAAVRREALARAAHDARANAQALAEAMQVKLGALQQLDAQHEVQQPRPYAMSAMRAESATSDSESSYQAGQIRITARVQAGFGFD